MFGHIGVREDSTVPGDMLTKYMCLLTDSSYSVRIAFRYEHNRRLPVNGRQIVMVYSHWSEMRPGQGPGTNGLCETVWVRSHYT